MFLQYIIVTRSGKVVFKQGPHCWFFRLNLKFLLWPYRRYIKIAKNGCFQGQISSWKWLWGCFNHFLLLWLWCQCFWGNWEDHCRSKRLSQMFLVCYRLLHCQNISSITVEKVGYNGTSGIPWKTEEVALNDELNPQCKWGKNLPGFHW